MHLNLFLTISFCAIIISATYAANILAIITAPFFSHQIAFRPLWIELDKRGHNLTLVTANPMKNSSLKNIKEIDVSYGYKYLEIFNVLGNAINDSVSIYRKLDGLIKSGINYHAEFFQSAEGQNLIHNRDNKFDLLFIEASPLLMTTFSWKYQIPFIGLSSLDSVLPFHEIAGNLIHPIVNLDPNVPLEHGFTINPTFWQRLTSYVCLLINRYMVRLVYYRENEQVRKYFGKNVPPIEETMKNLSMLFIVTNPIFFPVRPLMPNTITLGNGMHIRRAQKPLLKDEKDFLDGAKKGAIYFSLGSNIKGKHLNGFTRNELIKAFRAMSYRILWKIDDIINDENLLPSNLRAQKWFSSQPDILLHPNVKLFITQGGLQSMQESVYAGKPMLGIPHYGDQIGNVNRMVEMGYGLKINKNNITKESILEAVAELMTNFAYTQKAQDYQKIFRDVEIPNVDKAIWWTEYVLRHKGAKHFRNPLLDMPFWKIYMLDVFAFLFIILFAIFKTLRLISKLLFRVMLQIEIRTRRKTA